MLAGLAWWRSPLAIRFTHGSHAWHYEAGTRVVLGAWLTKVNQ